MTLSIKIETDPLPFGKILETGLNDFVLRQIPVMASIADLIKAGRDTLLAWRNQFDAAPSTFSYRPAAANQHFIPLFRGAWEFLLTPYSLLRNMLLCQLSILKNSTAS